MHIALEVIDFTIWDEVRASVAANFRRLNDLGLPMRITELDVFIRDSRGGPSDEELKDQARVFSTMLDICLDADCPSFNMWGFTDKYSWIPEGKPGFGSATIFDEDLQPKPAYFALQDSFVAR